MTGFETWGFQPSKLEHVGQTDVYICPFGCHPTNAHVVVADCYKDEMGGIEIVCSHCYRSIAYSMPSVLPYEDYE